jgi:hypothetical protein
MCDFVSSAFEMCGVDVIHVRSISDMYVCSKCDTCT